MADRKPAPSNAGSKSTKPGSAKPGTKPGTKPGARSGATATARPPAKKPGKSIVNQKQTPWGLIVTTVVIVAFAVAVVVIAVGGGGSKKNASANGDCTKMIGTNKVEYLNELQCAKDISGVTFTPEANRNHVSTTVKYDATPPVGGNHSPVWADCTGTVYAKPIADENAVHSLEHGAVWITYQPDLPADQIAVLTQLVNGTDRLLLSPYPGQKSPVSLQSWGYQLGVPSASDPRIQQFLSALKYNPKTTPEYGATCSNPPFKNNPSSPGKPDDGSGGSSTMGK